MRIQITARHGAIEESFRQFVQQRAERFQRYYDRIQEIDAVIEQTKGDFEVEIIVRADHHHRFFARERHSDARAAVDRVADHIERQLTRHKEQHRNRKHPDSIEPRESPAETRDDEDMNRTADEAG